MINIKEKISGVGWDRVGAETPKQYIDELLCYVLISTNELAKTSINLVFCKEPYECLKFFQNMNLTERIEDD